MANQPVAARVIARNSTVTGGAEILPESSRIAPHPPGLVETAHLPQRLELTAVVRRAARGDFTPRMHPAVASISATVIISLCGATEARHLAHARQA